MRTSVNFLSCININKLLNNRVHVNKYARQVETQGIK